MSNYDIRVQENKGVLAGNITGNVYYQGFKTPEKPRSLPRNVNSLYTGREDIAVQLHEAFHGLNEQPRTSPKCFVITGLGGTGKSEVCIKYAIDNWDRYWGIFWIDCSNESGALESFRNAGKLCGISDSSINNVRHFLSSIQEYWLLIIDNADDTERDFGVYIPSGTQGHVIITSREPALAEIYSNVGDIALDQLSSVLAEDLLLKAARVKDPATSETKKSAVDIVQELGRHTLAILHAGSYIRQYCKIGDYLSHYIDKRDRLFKHDKRQEASQYGTVHATFAISVDKLKTLRANGETSAEDALELLDVLTFLHYESFLERILLAASDEAFAIQNGAPKKKWREPSQYHADLMPRWAPSESSIENQLRWKACLNHLTASSLINVQESLAGPKITVHPLVHAWLNEQQCLNPDLRMSACLSTSIVIALAQGGDSYNPVLELLRQHMKVFKPNLLTLNFHTPQYALLAMLIQYAWFLVNYSDDHLVDIIDKIDDEIGGYMAGGVPPKGCLEAHMEAKLLRARYLEHAEDYHGSFNEAEEAYEQAKQIFPEDAPETLRCLTAVANSLRETGEIEQALFLHEEVVRVYERRYDERNFIRLCAEHELAVDYVRAGQVERGVQLLERVVDLQKENFQETDPARLIIELNLADAYLKNMQLGHGIELLEHIVNIDKRSSDESNGRRLASEYLLARAYLGNGQVESAIELLEHVAAVEATKPGVSAISRAATLKRLNKAYQMRNKAAKEAPS